MKNLIYEDKPSMDIWLWLILFLPSVLMLASGFVIMSNDMTGALVMFNTAFWVWAALYFIVIPAKYSIFEDRVSIISRSTLSFDIPFDTTSEARPGARSAISINLQTRLAQSGLVEIVRNKKMPVVISPRDVQEFMTNFKKALSEWQKHQVK